MTPESLILTPESSKLTPESEFDSGVSYTWRPSCEPLGMFKHGSENFASGGQNIFVGGELTVHDVEVDVT